jgi:exoribonuclease R
METKSGKLRIIDGKFYVFYFEDREESKNSSECFFVDDIEVINNRAIVNDEVYIKDNVIIGIKKRDIINIVGILCINSKVKYGMIKDKSLYLFKPSNKSYPNFYVPYKNTNNKNINIYTVINFSKWDSVSKLPHGILIEVIGEIGNKEVEYEHLRYYYNIKNNVLKVSKDKIIKDNDLLNTLKIADYEVFSIDPLNSKDIDDAFHFKILDKEQCNYEIGIHIASPYDFFKDDIKTILNRVSTIYLPYRKYNMLPNIYADNIISLIENELRYAISIIIIIKDNAILNIDVKKTIVKNIKNYDYNSFDKIYKKNNNLNSFVQFSKNFFNEDEGFDSHILVEKWMIFANKYIAKYLIDKNISNLIVRKNDISNYEYQYINNQNSELTDYLKLKKEHSALYEIYDMNKIQVHTKLGNDYYTHFTSPIRRGVDLFIHGLIIEDKNLIEDNNILEEYVNNINIFTKNSRKLDRNVKRLEFLYNSKKLEENIITYGYIVDINTYRIRIYIPQYKLEEKIIIIPYKFKDIVKINNISENIIDYTLDDKNYVYKLYQRLELKLWIFTSFENIFDKLKIEII